MGTSRNYGPLRRFLLERMFGNKHPYEPESKLLVSPAIIPIIVPYVILYRTPFEESRL